MVDASSVSCVLGLLFTRASSTRACDVSTKVYTRDSRRDLAVHIGLQRMPSEAAIPNDSSTGTPAASAPSPDWEFTAHKLLTSSFPDALLRRD